MLCYVNNSRNWQNMATTFLQSLSTSIFKAYIQTIGPILVICKENQLLLKVSAQTTNNIQYIFWNQIY